MLGFRLFAVFSCFVAVAAAGSNSAIPSASGGGPPMAPISGSELTGVFLFNARVINRDLYASMESFVCEERIDRYKGHNRVGGYHRDTITAKVSLENGIEQYSDLWRKKSELTDLSRLDGAWSKGEFGTLLKQTEHLLASQPVTLAGQERLAGGYTAIYDFEVQGVESPWDLAVSGHHYTIPFRTRVWISEASGRIFRIERTATEIPETLGIAEIRWSVVLSLTDLSGKQWLLPDTAEYDIIYRDSRRQEWNTMKFFGYHRYGAEVSVHFN
jgi:hypothetical protein